MTEGLRDQRKRATRTALHRAAVEIAHAEGIAAATVERIAERAEVSARTFYNYFDTKDDALAGVDDQLPDRLAAALLARPAGEELPDSLRAVVVEQMRTVSGDSELWRLRRVVAAQSPTLAAAALGSGAAASRALVEAAYERTGADPASDVAPAIQTFTAVGVLRAAMWLYAQRDFAGDVGALVDEAFAAWAEQRG